MANWRTVQSFRRIRPFPALVAIVLSLSPAVRASDDFPPIQLTDVRTPIEKATFAVQTVFDSTTGTDQLFHAAWVSGGKLFYRAGTITGLSRPKQVVTGQQLCADPVVFVLPNGKPGLVWAEERTPSQAIVPGEWNLRYTADVNVAPRWFTEDAGLGAIHADRNPCVAVQADTVLVVWERDNPGQIAYAFLSPRDIFPSVRYLTAYSYPATRPNVAADRAGTSWVAWTAETPTGGDIWVTRVSRAGVAAPVPIRLGAQDDRNCRVSLDANYRPYVVWQEGISGGPIHLVRVLSDGRLTPSIKVSPDGTAGLQPQLAFENGTIPCVTWRNSLTGDLEMVRVIENRVLGPVTVVTGNHAPRQESLMPAQMLCSSGEVISAFLAPDPIYGVANLWVSRGRNYTGRIEPTPDGDPKPATQLLFATQASPNPFNGTVALTAQMPSSGFWRVEVCSLDGRVMRLFGGLSSGPGTVRVLWGADDSLGRPVGSGAYVVRWFAGLNSGEKLTHIGRVTLVR